jgi:hypothetical protein
MLPFEVSFTTVHGFLHSAIMDFHRFATCSPLVRLLRHYFVVQCFEYSYTSLVSIFNKILEKYYNHHKFDLNYCYQKNLIQSISTTYVHVAPLLWPSVGVKLNIWKKLGFGVLRDSQMFRARQQGAKHLALGCSWCH